MDDAIDPRSPDSTHTHALGWFGLSVLLLALSAVAAPTIGWFAPFLLAAMSLIPALAGIMTLLHGRHRG
jgi:hypothetical protein